jgi:D-alanyl-D-alanine carboxypeptidase
VFTVTGLLQLADQGKHGLGDPIGEYIDGVSDGNKIALRELAWMQSGLYNYSATSALRQALFADWPPNLTPQELLGDAFAELRYLDPVGYSSTPTRSCWAWW